MAESALDRAIAAIRKKHGSAAIIRASEVPPVGRKSTGVPALDVGMGLAEGVPGVATHRVTFLVGAESAGKTTEACRAVAAFQLDSEPVVWVEVEPFDREWAAKQGVDLESLSIAPVETAEQAIDVVTELLAVLPNGLVVVDSLAAMSPNDETKASAEDWQRAIGARLLNKAFRVWQSRLNKASKANGGGCASVICIQQWRSKTDDKGTRVMPYGMGQLHAAGVMVELWRGKDVLYVRGKGIVDRPTRDKSHEVIGSRTNFSISKNKTAPPGAYGEFVQYTVHLDDPETGTSVRPGEVNFGEQLLSLGERWGVVTRAGSWYSCNGERIGQGRVNAGTAIERGQPGTEQLYELVMAREQERVDGVEEARPEAGVEDGGGGGGPDDPGKR